MKPLLSVRCVHEWMKHSGRNIIWFFLILFYSHNALVTPSHKSPSRNSQVRKRIFAKFSGMGLSRGSYGVYLHVTGSKSRFLNLGFWQAKNKQTNKIIKVFTSKQGRCMGAAWKLTRQKKSSLPSGDDKIGPHINMTAFSALYNFCFFGGSYKFQGVLCTPLQIPNMHSSSQGPV